MTLAKNNGTSGLHFIVTCKHCDTNFLLAEGFYVLDGDPYCDYVCTPCSYRAEYIGEPVVDENAAELRASERSWGGA